MYFNLMAERPEQCWETCRHSLGNLDLDLEEIAKTNPELRLLMTFQPPETEYERIFREEGIHSFYFCISQEMVEMCKDNKAYMLDGMARLNGGWHPLVILGSINPNEELGQPLDILEEERWIDVMVRNRVRMCTHCKFFKPKQNSF